MSQTAVLISAAAAIAATPIAAGTDRVFHHDLTTTASPAAIWRMWMDVSDWGRWDLGLRSASSAAPLKAGVMGRLLPLSGPASNFAVTEFVPGITYAFATSLPLATLTVRRTIVAISPQTVIRHDVAFSGPLAGFWAARLGPGFRAALPPTMQRLAGIAEAGDL